MKKSLLLLLAISGLFAIISQEVAKRSFKAVSGYKTSVSKTTMVLKNSLGAENVRKLEIKKLENPVGDKSLITFLYPADIKGTKLLSFEQIGRDDKQWLYLPALKRTKRISSRNKSGSFMGSEFSYEDIASQNYKNYTYQEEAEKVKKEGREFYKIARYPKDKNSGYSKQVVYVDTKNYLARFGEYYDKQKRLLKKVSFKEYRKIGNVYRIKTIIMNNLQNGKSTTLVWDEDGINVGLKKRELSKRALK